MKINEIYDQYIADHYDEDPYDLLLNCRLIAHQQIKSSMNTAAGAIVDLGSGTGLMVAELAKHYKTAQFVAIDSSAKMMTVAQEKIDKVAKGRVKTHVDNVMNLDQLVPQSAASLVNLHFILSYVDLEEIVAKSYDALNDDGLLSIITGTYDSCPYLQSLAANLISLDSIKDGHSMPKSVEAVKETLETNHFRIVKEDMYRKKIKFDNFKALHRLAIHSSWFVNQQVLNMSEADIDQYDEMTQSFFPLQDEMEIVILLAQKIT